MDTYEYWKDFRKKLTNILKENEIKLEKNSKNIYDMYIKIGLKSTARYFNIQNSQVLYYVKKYKKELNLNNKNM